MLDLSRAATLTNFDQVVTRLGGNPASLLEEVGLSVKLLKNPELFFQYNDFVSLLNLSSLRLQEDSFGLQLGCSQDLEIFGSVGYLLKNCKTIGDALINLKRFYHVHHTSADIGLSVENDQATLSFSLNITLGESIAQAIDLALAIGVNILKTLSSSKIHINSMHVQHNASSKKKNYFKCLGMVPHFNSTFNGIVFDAGLLDTPIDEADPRLYKLVASELNGNNLGYVDEIPKYVETMVRQNLAVTPISIEDIAQLMALSVRNLQRYLKEQDTSFRQIVDNVRNQLATQYLIDSTLSLNHISDVLGFSNYSEFSRAFKRWNQTAPKDYRNIHSPRKRFTRLKNM